MRKKHFGFQAAGLISALASVALGTAAIAGWGLVERRDLQNASLQPPLISERKPVFQPEPLPWPRPVPIPRPIQPLEPLLELQLAWQDFYPA